jgi:uncharacterized protein
VNLVRHHWRWLSLGVLAALLLTYYVAIPLIRVEIALHPWRGHPATAPTERGLTYEDVTFSSTDGLTLVGWYVPSRNRAAVILSHGFGGNRAGMLDQAEILARHGFGVLMYDSRAHGDSGGSIATRGWLEVNDLLGTVAYMQTRGDVDPKRIGAFGFSIGAQVTLRAAARTDKLRAVVADGASTATFEDEIPREALGEWLTVPSLWVFYKGLELLSGTAQPSWVLDALPMIAPRPLLLISTGRGFEQRQMRLYYAAAHDPKLLWEIPETDHGNGFRVRPQEYADKIVSFFSEALLQST